MRSVHWIETELSRHYENLDLTRGADLDQNGTIEGSERTDLNSDGNVDSAEWQKFVGDNKTALEKLGGHFKTYYSAGNAFRPDNPIHDLLSIESELFTPDEVKRAYEKVKEILRFVRKRTVSTELKPEDKLRIVYDVMKQLGIGFWGQDNDDNFISSINTKEKNLDCDLSSFVVLAIAHELNWPINLIRTPGHTFVRWDDGKGKKFNVDFGDIYPDEYYLREYNISQDAINQGVYMRKLNYNDVISQFYYNRGIKKSKLGSYEEAIRDYNKAIELNPNDARAYHNRGYAKSKLGIFDEAIRDYDKAIELTPNATKIYNSRGIAKAKLGRYEEAIKDFEKVIELDPNDAIAYNNRGTAKDKVGRVDEAIRDYNKVIELDPNDADAYYNRGYAKLELTRYKEAIKDFDKAIELDPNNTAAHNNREVAKKELGSSDETIREPKKALEINPPLPASAMQ